MKPGDILYIPEYEREGYRIVSTDYVKYEVVKIYKYFVHCRRVRFGYGRCFSRQELRAAGYEPPKGMR